MKTFWSPKRGFAAGPSGMTNEHIRILLDNHSDDHLMFLVREQLAQARVPPSIVRLVRQGRMTALRKDVGGVRGIVGDVVRRLISRTMVRQLGEAVKVAIAPFQYALSTRAGWVRMRGPRAPSCNRGWPQCDSVVN